MKRTGKFTLIEVLLVVAILAILFAILLPMLSRAKEYAYQVVCINNLKQIALAYQTYAADNNDEMPATKRWLDDFIDIYTYTNNLGIFICPATDSPELTSVDDLTGETDYFHCGTLTDIEKHANNGHGNNDYHFDISNPSPNIQEIIDAKTKKRLFYEKYYRTHFDGFNVVFFSDLHYERDQGVSEYWTLDENGWIERSLDPYPDLSSQGGGN